MWHEVKRPDGTVATVVTAAMVTAWHFDDLCRKSELYAFRPVLGQVTSRDARQTWIRKALLAALPLQEHEAPAFVEDVTPHSFRAGLASDVLREGHSLQTIGSICRWDSVKAITLYAERPCMSMFRKTHAFCVVTGTR